MEKWSINRKTLEIVIICVATFIIAIFSVTYAYFENQTGGTAKGNASVETDSIDILNFNVSNDISLTINQFNFGVGAGNLSDSATATASLKANNTTNTANYTYYVYFKINSNGFTYTTDDQKPEILLAITNPAGQAVTSIEGLTYKSNVTTTTSSGTQTVSGFDITNKTGTFAIASSYPITSNSSTSFTTQNWNITATFINLDTDQGANAGQTMNAEIIIQEEELKPTLAEYVISQYTDGSNGLYYHDTNLENGAGDNSYRYSGANPNNYVCFGSTASTCPSDNLYRIIGVFGSEVKLIKADYTTTTMTGSGGDYKGAYSSSTSNYKGSMNTSNIATYYWNNNTQTNTWSESRLNTTNLKSTYLSYIGTTWSNKIATHTWYVGGYSTNSATPKTWYNAESSGTTYSAKIGLMYVSDYGYAASNSYWTTNMHSYDSAINNNWMYMGLMEWTITPYSSYGASVFVVYSSGYLLDSSAVIGYSARPVFYLNSNVSYVSGEGTQGNPYRIN